MSNEKPDEFPPIVVPPTFNADELIKHVRIGHSVCMVENFLAHLTEHAGDITPELARRLLDSIAAYGDARRALIKPLDLPMPASDSRN